MRSPTVIAVYAVLSLTLGGQWIAAKLGVTAVPALELSTMRFAIASIALLAACAVTRTALPLRSWRPITAAAACGVLGFNTLAFVGISYTPASDSALIIPTVIPLATALFATLIRERLTSRKLMGIVRSHIEKVEVVGLDEAYLDLEGLHSPRAAMRRLVVDIERSLRLTCSVGIGPNKLVAKVASDAEKPDGFVVLSREQACERFAGASPGLIPGIGPKTVDRLRERGIETLGQLAAASPADLARTFGERLGLHLARLACFEDGREIETVRVAKSESRETTFDTDLHGLDALEPVLDRLSAELCGTLVRQERTGRTIGIKVRLDDFSTHTRAHTRDEATNDVAVVSSTARELLRRFDPPRPVRLLGVRVAGLDEAETGRQPHAAAAGQLELSM